MKQRQTRIIDENRIKKYSELLFNECNSYEQKEIFRVLKERNSLLIKRMINEKMKNDLQNCEVSK